MPRISKIEQAARAERQVRAGKAKTSILETLGKLLDRNIENLIKSGVETDATVVLKINGEGKASMTLTYSTVVRDGAAFELDDGQEELFNSSNPVLLKASVPAATKLPAPGIPPTGRSDGKRD